MATLTSVDVPADLSTQPRPFPVRAHATPGSTLIVYLGDTPAVIGTAIVDAAGLGVAMADPLRLGQMRSGTAAPTASGTLTGTGRRSGKAEGKATGLSRRSGGVVMGAVSTARRSGKTQGNATGTARRSSSTTAYTASAGPVSLGLYNPQFESALGSAEGDNWWPYISHAESSSSAARESLSPLAGAYSGRVAAIPWFDGEGDVPTSAALVARTTKATVDASTGHMLFRIRPVQLGGAVYILARVYNSGGVQISIENASGAQNAMLWGPNVGASANTTVKIAAPSTSTTYDIDLNMAAWLASICDWANASKVILLFVGASTLSAEAEFRIDEFQGR
jgi:hypothetical protein